MFAALREGAMYSFLQGAQVVGKLLCLLSYILPVTRDASNPYRITANILILSLLLAISLTCCPSNPQPQPKDPAYYKLITHYATLSQREREFNMRSESKGTPLKRRLYPGVEQGVSVCCRTHGYKQNKNCMLQRDRQKDEETGKCGEWNLG